LVDDDLFGSWFDALERRHLGTLTFAEVRRSVQALSSLYVERRHRLDSGSPFSGAGKRAAFALFFAPLHFLLVREIVRALNATVPDGAAIVDLGCGTGSAGAAWALEMPYRTDVIGVDVNSWALEECRWNYKQLSVPGKTRNVDVKKFRIPERSAVIAAFTMNELEAEDRDRILEQRLKLNQLGLSSLVIEPIAKRMTGWWDDWKRRIVANGGRADEWRFRVVLPERLGLMDRAAGLDHRELTGRSLWLPGTAYN
jgi:predicted RNA methylase